MRITAGANAWRNVEEVMGDRRISRKRKGNVLSSSYSGIHKCIRDDGTNSETTEGTGLREKKILQE